MTDYDTTDGDMTDSDMANVEQLLHELYTRGVCY